MTPTKPRSVLVVEDSATQAERVRRILAQRPYRVQVARDGRDALDVLRTTRPDLIISDIVMPEIDGLELCRIVKSDPSLRTIPVILFTEQHAPSVIMEGLVHGADNFILKSYDDAYLLDRVDRIFAHLDMRIENAQMDVEVIVTLGGRQIVITADRQQMIELLFSTFEELGRINEELVTARAALEMHMRTLEAQVEARTGELRESIAALRESEQRFRLLAEHAQDVIYRFRFLPDEAFEYISPSVETVLGYRADDFLADPSLGVRIVHPDDMALWRARFGDGGTTSRTLVLRYRHRDGQTVWMEERITRFLDEDHDHDLVAVEGILRDVTQRVRDERERQRLQAQLEQSQRLEALGSLAGGVAHDFNNLLAVILGYAGFVMEALPDDTPDARRDLEEIKHAAERAAALTRQLLVFARRAPSENALVDLNDVVAGTERLLRRTLGAHVAFRTELATELPAVFADESRLEQVLVNLVVNARDAMPGGGTVTVRTAVVGVEDDALNVPPGRYVRLQVLDTGEGIPVEVVDRVFEPFFTTKPKERGTGLGLATAHGIVTQAGGRIALESEVGVGTIVTVLLPVADGAPAPEPARAPAVSPASCSILLVEDNEQVRAATERMLRRTGFEVTAVPGPEQALATLRDSVTRFDVLLTDILMPGMSGVTLAREAKQIDESLKVLFMSGYPADVGDEGETGVMLRKPFSEQQLLQRLQEVLGG